MDYETEQLESRRTKKRKKENGSPWEMDNNGLLQGQKSFETRIRRVGIWTEFEQQILCASVRLVGEDLKLI